MAESTVKEEIIVSKRAFQRAIIADDDKVVQTYFSTHPDSINIHIVDRSPTIVLAAKNNKQKIVKLLIELKCDIDARDSNGFTALYLACCGGYAEMLQILMNAGADCNYVDKIHRTPIMAAAVGNHVNCMEALHENKAFNAIYLSDPTHGSEHNSLLMVTVQANSLEAVKLLLKWGVDKSYKNKERETALDWAKRHHRREMIEILEADHLS